MLSKCCVVQNTFVGPAMSLFAIILVLLLFSRGVFIFPILIAHNYFSKDKLPFRQMVVAWCAHITQAHIHHSCRAMFFTEVLFAQKHSLHRSTLCTEALSAQIPMPSMLCQLHRHKGFVMLCKTPGHSARVNSKMPPVTPRTGCEMCQMRIAAPSHVVDMHAGGQAQ